MIVEDRRISDEELISLYGVADYVWCRYSQSSSSMSSGVFGRAVQLGKTAVVSTGSYLDRLARLLRHPVVHDLQAECRVRSKGLNRDGNEQSASPGHGEDRLALLAQDSLHKLASSL
jgi:N-acetyl-beta-hexosaminidase